MRIFDPKTVDEARLAEMLAARDGQVVVQFSHRASYDDDLLAAVNRACERFGARLDVRFFGHAWKPFDCRCLRLLPAVRSLTLDTLRDAEFVEELEGLRHLEAFAFGVWERDFVDLLRMASLRGVRKLRLIKSKKSGVDLAPLAGFERLEELFLNGHAKNIGVLAGNGRIGKLGLSQMGKAAGLGFVRTMGGLRSLRVILGGRRSLEEMANAAVEELEVIRVQGLEVVDLKGFGGVKRLQVEDQIRLEELDLRPVAGSLERLQVANCKGLRRLVGLEEMRVLRWMSVGGTKVDPETVLTALPKGVACASLVGFGQRKDAEIRERLNAAGHGPLVWA